MRSKGVAVFSLLLALAFAGCAETHIGGRAELDRTLEAYNDLVRSQDQDTATAFLASTVQAEYRAYSEKTKNVRVVDYRITDVKYDEKTGQASANVEFEYYVTTSGIVKKVTDRQKWVYTGESGKKSWRLASPPPEFR